MEDVNYISYINVLRGGFSAWVNAMQNPNPVIEVYGEREAKKRLYDARVTVDKLNVAQYTNNDKELLKLLIRTYENEITDMIHAVSKLDLALCVQSVDKALRPEWWVLAHRLSERLDELAPLIEMYGEKVTPNMANENKNEVSQQSTKLPTIFGTDRERKVFMAAIDGGWMQIKDGRYVWSRTKSLLAYFLGKLYCDDFVRLDKSDYSAEYVKPKRKQLPRNEIKYLFGCDVGANRDVLRTPPRDYEAIDTIFKEASK